MGLSATENDEVNTSSHELAHCWFWSFHGIWHTTVKFMDVCFSYVHLGIVTAADRPLCDRRQRRGAGKGRGLCWARLSERWAPGAATGGSGTPPETSVLVWSVLTHTWIEKTTADYCITL